MSDSEVSEGSMEEVMMYRCRRCPGQEFTATERDLHRQQHMNQQREVARRRRRDASPNPPTLFELISSTTPEATPSRSPRSTRTPNKKNKPGPASSKGKVRRIRSKKKFDRHVAQPKNDGG